jgi:hypothetical protein
MDDEGTYEPPARNRALGSRAAIECSGSSGEFARCRVVIRAGPTAADRSHALTGCKFQPACN